MASVKGRTNLSWTSCEEAVVMKTAIALFHGPKGLPHQHDDVMELKGNERKAYIVKAFWRMFPFATDFLGSKPTDGAINGRAFTPWTKTKSGENPHKNPSMKPFVPLAQQIVDYDRQGRTLSKAAFVASVKARALTFQGVSPRPAPAPAPLRGPRLSSRVPRSVVVMSRFGDDHYMGAFSERCAPNKFKVEEGAWSIGVYRNTSRSPEYMLAAEGAERAISADPHAMVYFLDRHDYVVRVKRLDSILAGLRAAGAEPSRLKGDIKSRVWFIEG